MSAAERMNAEGLRLAARVLRGRPGYDVRSGLEQVPAGHALAARGWSAFWWVTDVTRALAVRVPPPSGTLPAIVNTSRLPAPSLCGIWPNGEPIGAVTIPNYLRSTLREFAKSSRIRERVANVRTWARFLVFPDHPVVLSLETASGGARVATLELHGSTHYGAPDVSMFDLDLLTSMVRGVNARVKIFGAETAALIEPTIGSKEEPEWLGLLMPRKVTPK